MSQYEAIRDSRIQAQAYWAKVREENKEVLREIRRVRQAIVNNLKEDSMDPIDIELDKRLAKRLEELKAIFN